MPRYWRQGQTGGRLALVLIAGTLPGVVAGSIIRVDLALSLGGWRARMTGWVTVKY